MCLADQQGEASCVLAILQPAVSCPTSCLSGGFDYKGKVEDLTMEGTYKDATGQIGGYDHRVQGGPVHM